MRLFFEFILLWIVFAALGSLVWLAEQPHPVLWATIGAFLVAHPIVSFASLSAAVIGFFAWVTEGP